MASRYMKSLDASGGLLVYDLVERRVVRCLSEWACDMTRKWSCVTLALRTDHVLRFLEYLSAAGRNIFTVTDQTLLEYRAEEFSAVMRNPRAIGSKRRARETVNERLRTIYGLLEWLQDADLLAPGWVGVSPKAAVRLERVVHVGRDRSTSKYPLLYRRTGAKSRHNVRLHVHRDRFDEAVSFLASQPNPYLAARDALILDIADQAGFRRGSINSLCVSQFDRNALQSTAADSITVRPPRQKLEYENEFEFPVLLALRVVEFVENERQALLNSKGPKGKKAAGDAIFLSSRTAGPLTDRAISQIVSRAFRGVGCQKGVATHSGRRLFAVEAVEQEIDDRLRLGLDTSTASICAAVAIKMGHANTASLHPYVVAALSRRAAVERSARRRREGQSVQRNALSG